MIRAHGSGSQEIDNHSSLDETDIESCDSDTDDDDDRPRISMSAAQAQIRVAAPAPSGHTTVSQAEVDRLFHEILESPASDHDDNDEFHSVASEGLPELIADDFGDDATDFGHVDKDIAPSDGSLGFNLSGQSSPRLGGSLCRELGLRVLIRLSPKSATIVTPLPATLT